jgi:hypothetical protein
MTPPTMKDLERRTIEVIPSDFDATGVLLSFACEILGTTSPPAQTEADS